MQNSKARGISKRFPELSSIFLPGCVIPFCLGHIFGHTDDIVYWFGTVPLDTGHTQALQFYVEVCAEWDSDRSDGANQDGRPPIKIRLRVRAHRESGIFQARSVHIFKLARVTCSGLHCRFRVGHSVVTHWPRGVCADTAYANLFVHSSGKSANLTFPSSKGWSSSVGVERFTTAIV